MRSRENNRFALAQRSIAKKVLIVCAVAIVVKVSWLFSLPSKGILGADGENYLAGVKSLSEDGLFSSATILHYWPAGYPILIWPIQSIFGAYSLFMIGLVQSLLFAYAVFFFSLEIYQTKLRKFTIWIAIILSASPTLSLNSLAIGYEVPCAALLLIAVSFLHKHRRLQKQKVYSAEILYSILALSLASFMQPRLILLAVGIFIPFAFLQFLARDRIKFMLLACLLMAISPAILVLRNYVANDFIAVSTNLGVTMNIGAGNGASGGYSNDAPGVSCELKEGNAAEKDKQLVACVMRWYLDNPTNSVELFVRKFAYHWSPWFGPLSNGTSARNPWLNFNPLVDTARNSESGYKMVFGSTGLLVSWIWMIFQFILMFYGFWRLLRKDQDLKILAWMLFTPVILNSMSSMATIGDNRFRIPTLTLSIALQSFGLFAIFSRATFRQSNPERRLK